MTGLLTEREMQAQVLDNMDLERERGITIKSQAVRIVYKAKDGDEYIFNLIDTLDMWTLTMRFPEALLPVTERSLLWMQHRESKLRHLANVYMALDHDLDVVPVINKIDLPSADPSVLSMRSRM